MMEVEKIDQTLVSCAMLWPHINISTIISNLYFLDTIHIFHLLTHILPSKEQHILGSLTFKVKYFFYSPQHLLYHMDISFFSVLMS